MTRNFAEARILGCAGLTSRSESEDLDSSNGFETAHFGKIKLAEWPMVRTEGSCKKKTRRRGASYGRFSGKPSRQHRNSVRLL